MPTGFADLGDLPEKDRIEFIVQKVRQEGIVVGFVVETEAKATRYLKKMKGRVRVIGRGPGPVANTVLVRVGPLVQ